MKKKNVAKNALAPLGLTAAMSAVDGSIKKKMLGSGTTTLISSNNEMNDIIKIVKPLEDSGVLLKGISKKIQHEAKEQKGGFLVNVIRNSRCFIVRNFIYQWKGCYTCRWRN